MDREEKAVTPTETLPIGATIPDVGLRDLDGRVRRLADYRGQPLLIFMWASW
jgi:peroxiredoxin